jgi:CheY-like chemotaxis protein
LRDPSAKLLPDEFSTFINLISLPAAAFNKRVFRSLLAYYHKRLVFIPTIADFRQIFISLNKGLFWQRAQKVMAKEKTLKILLVDDDALDRELFIEAMEKTTADCSINEVGGGNEALEYLQASAASPNLIVLDLNMPLKDGRETLKDLKANKNFQHIPVIILSTSKSHFDILQSYESGASLFMEKPHDFDQLTEMVHHLVHLSRKFVSFAN